MISERWQQEVAETVFEAVNADTDKVEMRKRAKNKQLGHEEGTPQLPQGPRCCHPPLAGWATELPTAQEGQNCNCWAFASYAFLKKCMSIHGGGSRTGQSFNSGPPQPSPPPASLQEPAVPAVGDVQTGPFCLTHGGFPPPPPDYALGKDCIMHGYMLKLGNPFLTQWQRRYFYLFPNRLEWRGEGESRVSGPPLPPPPPPLLAGWATSGFLSLLSKTC